MTILVPNPRAGLLFVPKSVYADFINLPTEDVGLEPMEFLASRIARIGEPIGFSTAT